MRRFILILLLGFLASFSQAQVNTKYKTSTGDGYDGSRSESFVWEIFQPEAVCVGEDALFTMQLEGSLLYSYRWYKIGDKANTMSTESFLLIKGCQADWNGRKYMCEITDLNTGQVFQSEDTFRLNVMVKPVVTLNNTKVDTTVCYGQKLNLKVLPDGEDYVYTWFGAGIVGETYKSQITVMPEEDTQYEVTISNGYCVSDPKKVSVHVKHTEVKLPHDIVYTISGAVKLTPSRGEGGTLDWYVNGAKYADQEEFNWNMPSDLAETTVKVTRTVNKCSVSDSAVILNELAMRRFIGGDNDGFVESMQKVSVSGITPVLSEICRGDDAYFACNVGTIGTFTYQWYRLADNGTGIKLSGATNNLLVLETMDMSVSGKYYCVVYDLDTKQSYTTDPATLVVIERPEIDIVTPDTAICEGGQIVLSASRGAEDGEIFRWNGLNIQTNPTYQDITVAPNEAATYQLVAMKGTCLTTREVKVSVNKVQLHLPDVVDILLGDEVKFTQPEEEKVRYTWTVGGSRTSGNTLVFTPSQNTLVHLEKGIGLCKVKDSTWVYLKEYGVGLTTEAPQDGYAESVLPFHIISLDCPQKLCVGDEAMLNIEVAGYDVYQYTWKKRNPDGSVVVLDSVKQHTIPIVAARDAGIYFCEVKDMHSGEVLVSDEITMEILARPIAGIVFAQPALGDKESCWICAGTTLVLQADQAKGLTYQWEGLGILGATDKPSITALPEETTDYSLVVSNGVCNDMAFVQVNLQDISVNIPEVMFVAEGEAFTVAPDPAVSDAAKLKWVYNNGASVEAAKYASSGVTKSGYLKVTMSLEGCEAHDSTRIYVRGYNTFQGGAEDGFVESNSSFMIQDLHYPPIICENNDADFSIRVKGSGIYSYNWKQLGLSTTLSTESVFSLSGCSMAMNGQQYYCLVTDLMLGKTLSSDTIALNIRKGPQVIIGYPERGKSYCIGTKIRLDARETENSKESPDIEYVYSWEGQNVTETEYPYAVDIQPATSQVYTLKVSAGSCSSYDTIQINIVDPRVTIPSVIYAEENQLLKIEAEVANVSVNATINWWHNALFTPNKNPFVITDITESANVIAEVVDRGCKSSDTARVYVRTNRFFAGGEDDGFMESCNIPEINPDVTTVLGCGGVDSVEMNVAYNGDPKMFVWQRYDKGQGKFVELAENDHLFGLGTPNLKIKPLVADYYGQYRCVLTNDCGSAYSLTYQVSNGNAPEVAVHIDTMTVCEGVKDHRIVMALKEDETVGDVTYRWYKKNPVTGVVVQFTPEASFNKVEYIIPEVTPEYDALYLKEAEGVCGVAMDSVRLIVNKKVSFRIQPKDTLVCYNTNVPLHAYSQNGGICSYTLKKVIPDNSLFEGYRIDKICRGNGGNRYDFKPISMDDDGYYVWTVKSICGDSVTSRMFKVTVEKPVQFIGQTQDTTVCIGTILTLNVEAESPDCPDSKITYAWEKLSEGKLSYQTPTINLTVAASTGGNYICSATNVCGTENLINPIQVSIHPELVITQNPVWTNAGVCEEKVLELNFAVNRMDIVDSIRWYRKEAGVSVLVQNEGSRITGADDYNLKIDSIRTREKGTYYARIYNICGVYETTGVQINVDEKAKIIKPIEFFFDKTTVCLGEEADLKISAAGKQTLIYTWTKNGSTIKGESDSIMRVQFDEDAVYRCMVHNYCAEAYSEWVVNVVRPDTFRFKEVDVTHYCEGESGVRLQLAGSDPKCTYSLYRQDKPDATPELVQEIKGADAPFTGGSLDFGIKPAGLYHVMAYDPDIDCHGRMPGDVTVIMDSLPKAFNTLIGNPICEGNATGTVILDNSQYALSQRYQYILQKQEGSEWVQFNKVVYGTGDSLFWENILTGIYRIEAVDRQTKCTAVMNGTADLTIHPNPVICDLVQYRGDTAYCGSQQMNVALKIKTDCFTDGQTYTLMKDQALTDQVKTDNSGWENLTEGEYNVVVKNEWGCADTTNTIRIHNYPLPAIKEVTQDRYYCDGEVAEGETALIMVAAVDPKIKYAFYRKGETAPFEEIYKETASYVSTEVSLVNAHYYVIATDTATGCSVPMKDTVKIQGSQLELSYIPVTMDRSENSVRLNLTVKNAIGKITVKWEPEDQIQDLSDPLRPWVDMTDVTKNTFIVTVSDVVCTKTEKIVVSLEGQPLTASIKDPVTGAGIPKDTLWICEGAPYSLDGEVLGGKEPFGYEWSLDGTYLGNSKKLTNALATKSGNIVFRVGSNGRVVRDTVRLELYPAPGKGLKVNPSDLCISAGDVFSMSLINTTPGVTYSLEYSKNNDVFKNIGVTVNGDASGVASLQNTLTADNAGYYRVKAVFTYDGTTCQSLHDTVKIGMGILDDYPAPVVCDLVQYRGDTIYCAGGQIDAALRMNTDCFAEGQTYTLMRNQVVTDQVRTDNRGWDNLTAGEYAVVVKNEWGCADTTNTIRIHNYPLPAIKEVQQDRYYCDGEVAEGETALITVTSVDPKIKYAFYRKGETTPFEEIYKKTASSVSTEVSLVNAHYYVIATDTATGCSVPMKDTVKIQGSQLELSHTPVTMEPSDNPVRLNLTVKNAIGKTTIKWEPEGQIQDLSDPLHPWVDMTDLTKNTFTVTVSDTVCTKTEKIIVSLDGQPLTASIKDPVTGAGIPKDTLWICEGATYSLDGEVLGGKEPFSYEWSLDGTYLGNNRKLTNAVATKSGNIVFRVNSNVSVVRDTVRLELYPAPGKGLEVNTPVLCFTPGDVFSMNLMNTLPGVTYALEYSKNNDVFKNTSITVNGDASGLASLQDAFTEDKTGYYRVKAMFTYDGTTCQSLHDTVKIGMGIHKADFHGGGNYCSRNGQDSLVLDSTLVGANYWVVYKASAGDEFVKYDEAGITEGNGDSLFIVGDWPSGIYRMVAQRKDGVCVDTMPGEVVINHAEKPDPGTLISDQMVYCVTGESTLNVTISLSGAVAGNRYKFYRQNGSSVEMLGSPILGQTGEITFGTDFSQEGRYFAVADNGTCQDTAGYVLIKQLSDEKIEIVKVDTGYCAGNAQKGISLNLYPADADMKYYIYPAGSASQVAECDLFVDDSVQYKGELGAGDYVIKVKVAECEKEIGAFTVKEYALPNLVDLLEPQNGCEGTMLGMGVKNSQPGILYEAYHVVDDENTVLKAGEYGDGNDLVVVSADVAGTYYLQARDTSTGCVQMLESYAILAKPKNFDFVATDTVYCAFDEESGTQLALKGTESGVVYILQQYDEAEAKFKDIQPQVALAGNGVNAMTYFNGIYKAGKYRVRTTTCEGSLIGEELEISEILLPAHDIIVELTGNACVDSMMNITIKATENDVKYSLWTGNAGVQSELTGDGTDQYWTVDPAVKGTYEVHALRAGATNASCAVTLDRKITVETIPLMQNLAGTTPICQHTTTSLRIPIVEKEVKYYLYNEANGAKVSDGIANKTNVTFEHVNPGTYYAVAAHGDCKVTSPLYTVDSILVPEIQNVLVDYSECTEQNAGQIVISDLQDTLTYVLIYPNGREESYSKTVVSSKTYNNLEIGTYYLKVQDNKTNCFSLRDTLHLNHAIPAGDTLIGQFGYCEGTLGAKLKLGHSSVNIVYTIMNTSGDTIESIFGGMGQSFLKYYKEGEYVFVAERQDPYGGCQLIKNIRIKKFATPALTEKLELQETGALCAGSEYHISVVDAQEDITYILYKGKTPVDTVAGKDKLDFKAVNGAGDYTVIPKSGGICGNKALDTLFHINALPTEILVEQPSSYCNPVDAVDEVGAALKIYNTVGKICYVLNDGSDNVDTLYGDYSLAYQEFDKMPAGSYTIVATDTLTKCSAVVGSGIIEKNNEPKRFICGLDDQRCAIAAPVEIEDSETDVDYYLHRDGKKIEGPIAGADGTAISFGEQTESGIYQILAKSKLGCSVYMKDSVVIYPPLIQDTLVVKGSYCEGGESDINFRLRKQSLYWKYFILKAEDNASSDTLAGAENTVLLWNEIGGRDIRSGKYRLYAMNPCGEVQKLDSVIIDTNHLPEKYLIEEGDFTLCTGDSGSITLAGSQAEVEYDLMYQPVDGTERRLLTKRGTGDKLLLAKVDNAGKYTVIGRMKETGCTDTIAEVKVNLVDGIQDPGINAEDICLTGDPGQVLDVSIRMKYDYVSYYLQHINGPDTLVVDSIKWGVAADLSKKEFASQTDEGIYRVVAQGPTCKKEFRAAMIGKAADDQELDPAGVASICGGKAREIGLKGSQVGVQYEVYKVVQKYIDSDTISTNIVATGTGSGLKLGEITESGVYLVKALNGCSVLMSDTLKLNVNEAYKITLREGGYTICGANDSVRIEILGRTNPIENAQYLIYTPGSTTFSELLASGNKEESVHSAKWYKEPGFYRVEGIDATGCPEVDSVEIKVLPLPEVYPIVLRGNKYLCDSYSKKEIVVEGAQTGVDYHLYRVVGSGAPVAVTMKTAQSSDVEISFTANQEGTYYVVGQYNDKGNKSCPVRMDGEIELTSAQMHQYALESIRDSYCENPSVTNRGEVKLINSDLNVEYQLYRDGVPYGDPKTTSTAGEILIWKGLSGGVPKMSPETEAKPVKYTVKAINRVTGCEVDMNGTVNVIGERSIVFSEKQLQDAIPTCLGSRLNMIVLAYGGKIEYQWMKGTDALADGKQYYYTKEAIEAGDIGTYTCQMTNTCGTVTTPEVEVVPALLVDRTDTGIDTVVVCNLKPEELRDVQVSSRVANADKWEWYKDGVLLEGEIYKWLEVAVSAHDGAVTYTSKASNSCGFVWDTCVILVDSTPRIELMTPIHKDTLCEGVSWELKVNATQAVTWMQGTQNIAYTGNVMKIEHIQTSDEGTYFVVADNRCGERKEEVASLVVDSPIEVISKQDQFNICRQSGDLPHLFIQTKPKDRVYYRWEDRKGTVLSTTNELNNIDLKKYSNLVDTFRVYYGNTCEDSYKDIALVTSDYIQFKQPEEEVGVCVVDMLSDTVLRVEVMNDQNVTYKWYKLGRNDITAARDSVGNADTLVISLDKSKYAGYYYCYMANQCVDTVSRMVNVRIDTIPEILVTLPAKDTLCSSSEMKLKVSARAGEGSLSYVWYVKKKGENPVKVASALYYGLSQSEYSCFVDDSYDGALVWCDVSTTCTKPDVDTLHLTVLPSPQVSMSILANLNCEGQKNEIYVKLDKGDEPWKYKYSVNEKENAAARTVAGQIDTLKVTEPGVYRVYWLADSKCILTGKELAVTEYKVLRRSKFTIEAVDYSGPVCPDSDITLRVKITGGVPGPWNVGIYREADGELASELGFEAPVYTLDSVYTCSFKIQKDEKYFAKVTNVYEKQECEAEALVKSVELKVFEKPVITMNELKPEDRILSACSNVSLGKLFDVKPNAGGWYVVGNQQLSGDWILNPEQKKYTVNYRIYQDGCVFDGYNLGEVEFRPKPELKMDIDYDVLCSTSENAKVTFNAQGEYPVKVVYRVLNLHKDGKTSLESTPDYTLTAASPSVDIRFYYDEDLAGKIIEVLRVEDKFKCTTEDISMFKDTVLFPERPVYQVYTKKSDVAQWVLTEDETYQIRTGDSIDVKVELKKGDIPWMIVFGEKLFGNSFQVKNIPTARFDTALYKAGLYEIDVQDNYCPTSVFETKPYVTLNVIDTAYLALKAYLQGPWDAAQGKMVSAVLSQIDKHGLTSWPNVGSRKIIDWVEVELWTDNTEEFWDAQRCLLLDDGTIVDTEGNTNLRLIGKTSAMKFRVAIRSRNHLAVWSKAVDLSATTSGAPCKLDFTKVADLYVETGETVKKYAFMDATGRMLLYGGDVNSNRLITSFDPNRITREVLSMDALQGNGALILDINYNGKVEWPGYNVKVDGSSSAASEFLDWSIMYKNRLRYSIVPEREINW